MSWARIKHALNSTLGTPGFQSLDAYVSNAISNILTGSTIEYDTAGKYTYTVPAGVRVIYVTACGGGGGGGAGSYLSRSYYGGGGGGGGAAVVRYPLYVKNQEKISITVGSGGVGGEDFVTSSSINGDGEDGGDTQIASLILPGGKGGKTRASGPTGSRVSGGASGGDGGGAGGMGGSSGSSSSSSRGTDGEDGITGAGGSAIDSIYYGGGGGGSLGNGGNAGASYQTDSDRVDMDGQKGGGGSGAYGNGARYYAGKGGDGYVKIETGPDLSPIKHIQRGTAQFTSYSADTVTISLSGFSNIDKMIVLLNGASYSNNNNNFLLGVPYMSELTLSALKVNRVGLSSGSYENEPFSYQVIEFS